MGKRNYKAKIPPKKRTDKLDTVFSYPFCIHGTSVGCRIMYSELISTIIQQGGSYASRTSFVKLLRSVKRETLKLIETFLHKAEYQPHIDTVKERSYFWRLVLLQLKVTRADIMKDGIGREMAKIEVFLEETAELVDQSQPKNPTYYR